jgi:hypothetical protein
MATNASEECDALIYSVEDIYDECSRFLRNVGTHTILHGLTSQKNVISKITFFEPQNTNFLKTEQREG